MHAALVRWRGHRADPVALDRALAVLLAVVAQADIWAGHDASHHRVAGAVFALAITAPIAVRRRHPALVGAGVPVLGAYAFALWQTASIAYPLAGFLALYALAVWTPTRHFAWGIAAFVAGSFTPGVGTGGAAGAGGAVAVTQYDVVVVVVMLLVRRIVGDRERRAELAGRERELSAREAVVEERTRIARELHDVVAHNVSMMVVQAGAERRVLGPGTDGTREVLEAIERTGRSALTEMRRLVGMLRNGEAAPLAPGRGLAEVPELVDQVRDSGLRVDLEVVGEPRDLPAGIGLSAYRIVQEALTNTLQHAGEASAIVRISYREDSLELEIADNGSGPSPSRAPSGHGLVGMRERAALYGGEFAAGGRPGGGFAVRVVLPVR